MAYTKYSLTPADNNAAPPNGAPEGMLPSAVNDTMRDMMSQIRDVGDGIRGGTYTMTAPVITGGSISGASVSATSLTDSGNLTFTGTGNRILGDFSNATLANRVGFQTSTTNSNTTIPFFPNGTGTVSGMILFGASDITNTNFLQVLSNGVINAGITGSGTYQPLTMFTGGSERLRIDTSGNVGIGISPTSYAGGPNRTLQIYNSASANAELRISNSTTGTGSSVGALIQQAGNDMYVWNASNSFMSFGTNATERMRVDSSGNLLVGRTSTTGNARFAMTTSSTSNLDYGFFVSNSAGTRIVGIDNNGGFSTGVAAGSPYNATTGSAANVFVNSDGVLLRSTSSLKYKNSVQNAIHGLAEVLQLRPVTYKGKNDGDTVFGGLIAEEVHEAGLTEFVQYADDGTPDALNYGNMVSLAFKAIQELKAEVDSLKTTVDAQAARIAALEFN